MSTYSYQQITGLGSAVKLTLPNSSAERATIIVETAAVRMRKDGTAPTATVGMPIPVGTVLTLAGIELREAQFIQQAAGAVLNVEFESGTT